jgi:hypothetical protein
MCVTQNVERSERRELMRAGKQNLYHALAEHSCLDPDCEIHNPDVIEDQNERFTALAWFYAGAILGAHRLADEADSVLDDLREDTLNDQEIPHLGTLREA